MEEEIIDEECLNGLMFLEFYEKILGENYYFNNYKAMKDLIKTFCTNNLRLSKKIASCCFKNLTHYQENIFSYLEAIKELVLIEDQISSIRRDAIFGFPTLLDMKDFWKKVKYGFQVHKDLTLSAIKYRSPLNFNTNPTCLLKLVYENFEKKDNNCLIYLVYLLDMMLENKEVFKQIVELPSPFHLYANFCDWFIHFAAWYEKDKTISTHSIYGVSKAVLYEEPFKLKLDAFKEKYLEFIEENYPDAPTDKFKILADDSADKNWNFPIFPLSNTLIVGCAKTEELEKEVTIYEGDSDYISIKVSQLSVLAVPSVPTGHTNLSLPTCFRKKHTVYTTSLPKGCGLQKFFDCDEENSDKGRDNEYSVGQSLRQQETGGSKRTPGVVLNIPLNHITGDYDDDDETYPSNTGSTKQATELGSTLSDDKASAKEPASEVFNEEYDMRYFKTNYVLK
jgi:hypothetical protein